MMKWFFALNELCPTFLHYADMVKVAVHTAFKHTTLVPHFLYDGADDALTGLLRKRTVPIIRCRMSLFDRLQELAQDPQILAMVKAKFPVKA
jgi:hypothetical protein